MFNPFVSARRRSAVLSLFAVPLAVALVACSSSSQTPAAGSAPFHVHAIYSESANAPAEVQQAIAEARQQHKRVILDFGGNWCGDCQVLDYYFHQPPNAALLARNYILVDINIGQYDRNLNLAAQYGIPLQKGVPALAVLDSRGHLLYSQRQGEFESMRRMDPSSVTQFLDRWKTKS